MTHFTKAIASIAIIAAMGSTASAGENGFEARFSIEPSASLSSTYDAIETQANRTCTKEIRRAGYRSLSDVRVLKDDCVSELVAKAVKASDNAQLVAYHNRKNNVNTQPYLLAQK
jgi:hypothetical protein